MIIINFSAQVLEEEFPEEPKLERNDKAQSKLKLQEREKIESIEKFWQRERERERDLNLDLKLGD